MQYLIEGSRTRIQALVDAGVFDDYPCKIKNNQITVTTNEDKTITFFSMVQPAIIDFVDLQTVRFTLL